MNIFFSIFGYNYPQSELLTLFYEKQNNFAFHSLPNKGKKYSKEWKRSSCDGRDMFNNKMLKRLNIDDPKI